MAKRIGGGGMAVWALAAAVGTSPRVEAFGSLSGGSHAPLEQRVAVAVGAGRTVVWSQLRIDAGTGPFAVVVPAAPGAALDWSSDAWMEALEEATAPAVLPPEGVAAVCPGEPEDPDRVHLVGRAHAPTVTPLEVVELADANALASWAGQHGMVASSALYATLAQSSGPFVAARFSGSGGATLTPTLRIVRPDADTSLPFVLTEGMSQAVDVTLFTLATAGPVLDGEPVSLSPQALIFDVAAGTSNYEARRSEALTSSDRWLLECSSHPRLDEPLDLTPGTSLSSLLGGYFIRGTAYEPVGATANDCFALASVGMQGLVGTACPSASIGVVGGGGDGCVETNGSAPPSTMRCGLGPDAPLGDLALAFSGQLPQAVVLSRVAMRVGAGEVGASTALSFSTPSDRSPALEAAALDFDGCPGGGGASSGASSGSTGSTVSSGAGAGRPGSDGRGGSGTRRVPVYERTESSCGNRGDVGAPLFYTDVDDTDAYAPDAYYTEDGDDCGGDTSGSYDAVYDTDGDGVSDDVDRYEGDDCGGDTYDDEGSDYEGDDCGGDTYDDEGSDYEGDDCGGDTYEDEQWASDYEEDCGGDSSEGYEWEDDDCSGDTSDGYDSGDDCDSGDSSSSDGCSISRGRRRRPRMSAVTLSLVALLFPMRRWRRPRRRRKRRVKRG